MANGQFFHGGPDESAFRQLLDQWRGAIESGDDEAAQSFWHGALALISHQMYSLTREVATDVRAALHAVGHTSYANLVCQVYITFIPTVATNEHGEPDVVEQEDENGDKYTSSVVCVGTRMHGHPENQEEFEEAFNSAVVSALRAHGFAATWQADGTLAMRGRMSHFDEHMEAEAAKFAEDIEKELGESAPDPETGERKWW